MFLDELEKIDNYMRASQRATPYRFITGLNTMFADDIFPNKPARKSHKRRKHVVEPDWQKKRAA